MLRVIFLMVVVTSGFWLNDLMETSQPQSFRGVGKFIDKWRKIIS